MSQTFIIFILGQGFVQVMAETLLRWHSPGLQEKVQKAVDTVVATRGQKEHTEAELILSLTSSTSITASTELRNFMGHIKKLNNVCSEWVAICVVMTGIEILVLYFFCFLIALNWRMCLY